MRNPVILTIPEPCSQKWNSFTPTAKGGYCSSCQKEVIDFTNWTAAEIQVYFISRRGSVCGQFKEKQLINQKLSRVSAASFNWMHASVLSATLLLNPKESEAQELKSATSISVVNVSGFVATKSGTGLSTEVKITGTVRDSQKLTMPGVSIILKGTSTETSTNADGVFTLTIRQPAPTDVLVISFIGYVTQEVVPYEKNEVDVVLAEDEAALNEVIRVGGVCFYRRWSPRGVWYRIKNIFRR